MSSRKITGKFKDTQSEKFKRKAREVGADEDEAAFDATLNKISSHKLGAPMAKELKTSAELHELLLERVMRFSVGRIPNPQWIKIVPADPIEEGANWKVVHSSRTVPTGEFSDAIERVMRELQRDYDLSSLD